MKHTPGPWTTSEKSWTVNLNGKMEADLGCHAARSPVTNEEMWANARLIAAAPELLECLEKIFFEHAIVGLSPDLNMRIVAIIGLIRGES